MLVVLFVHVISLLQYLHAVFVVSVIFSPFSLVNTGKPKCDTADLKLVGVSSISKALSMSLVPSEQPTTECDMRRRTSEIKVDYALGCLKIASQLNFLSQPVLIFTHLY